MNCDDINYTDVRIIRFCSALPSLNTKDTTLHTLVRPVSYTVHQFLYYKKIIIQFTQSAVFEKCNTLDSDFMNCVRWTYWAILKFARQLLQNWMPNLIDTFLSNMWDKHVGRENTQNALSIPAYTSWYHHIMHIQFLKITKDRSHLASYTVCIFFEV